MPIYRVPNRKIVGSKMGRTVYRHTYDDVRVLYMHETKEHHHIFSSGFETETHKAYV